VNDGGSGGEGGLGDGASVEAGLVDGSVCVNIDITTYSLACTTASDCIDIFIGDLCSPSACTCYQAYVSITEQARYDQAINQLPPNTCTCSTLPPARCFSGSCVHG
jgi:hypothetical protein